MIRSELEKLMKDKGVPGQIAEELAVTIASRIYDVVRECRTTNITVPCPFCLYNSDVKILIGIANTATETIACSSCKQQLVVTVQTESKVTRIIPKGLNEPKVQQLNLDLQ
jgi:hypothetical protein